VFFGALWCWLISGGGLAIVLHVFFFWCVFGTSAARLSTVMQLFLGASAGPLVLAHLSRYSSFWVPLFSGAGVSVALKLLLSGSVGSLALPYLRCYDYFCA
jgi:hypothetical protein